MILTKLIILFDTNCVSFDEKYNEVSDIKSLIVEFEDIEFPLMLTKSCNSDVMFKVVIA